MNNGTIFSNIDAALEGVYNIYKSLQLFLV